MSVRAKKRKWDRAGLEIRIKVFTVDAGGEEVFEAGDDGGFILFIGDAKPGIACFEHLDGDTAFPQKLADIDGQEILGFQRVLRNGFGAGDNERGQNPSRKTVQNAD